MRSSSAPARSPGSISGTVISQKTPQGPARDIRAASSSTGFIRSSTPSEAKNTIGYPYRIITPMMPTGP